MRRAYRRPVTDADLAAAAARSIGEARTEGDFDAGIEMALSRRAGQPAVPVPRRAGPGRRRPRTRRTASATSSWRRGCRSSCGAAFRTTSCSTSRRAASCTSRRCSSGRCAGCWPTRARRRWSTNFAAQWLHLRNLDSITPDLRLFPDFDDNLRQAFRQETELLLRERPARGPQRARSAERRLHVPQRAAGEALRHPARLRQPLPPRRRSTTDSERGGLLRHGSILTVTSYATRTSPVIRGKWILENLLGAPPPPPPPDVPALEGQHRRRRVCRSASGWPSTAPTPPARAATT